MRLKKGLLTLRLHLPTGAAAATPAPMSALPALPALLAKLTEPGLLLRRQQRAHLQPELDSPLLHGLLQGGELS